MIGIALILAAQKLAPPPIVTVRTPPPIVRTNRDNSLRFDSWVAGDYGDYTAAHTTNESGSRFGVMCGQSCIVYLNLQIDCEKGVTTPAMVNSKAGAYPITLRCHHIDDRRLFSAELTDDYIDVLDSGGEIGFAVPLASGRFGVSRYSLTGSIDAIAYAITAAEKKAAANQKGLRDFTI